MSVAIHVHQTSRTSQDRSLTQLGIEVFPQYFYHYTGAIQITHRVMEAERLRQKSLYRSLQAHQSLTSLKFLKKLRLSSSARFRSRRYLGGKKIYSRAHHIILNGRSSGLMNCSIILVLSSTDHASASSFLLWHNHLPRIRGRVFCGVDVAATCY